MFEFEGKAMNFWKELHNDLSRTQPAQALQQSSKNIQEGYFANEPIII